MNDDCNEIQGMKEDERRGYAGLNIDLVNKLRANGFTISSAESCTGGMFSAAITDVAGASDIFKRGFVTYSKDAKIEELGVAESTIRRCGVVSSETASEMAEGARIADSSDIAISITGYSGPDAGEGLKAGVAFIGYSYDDRNGAIRVESGLSDRKYNRQFFVFSMLRLANSIMDSWDEQEFYF